MQGRENFVVIFLQLYCSLRRSQIYIPPDPQSSLPQEAGHGQEGHAETPYALPEESLGGPRTSPEQLEAVHYSSPMWSQVQRDIQGHL